MDIFLANQDTTSKEMCPSECTPASADRAQCGPGKYTFRYDVSDSLGREATDDVLIRVEAGASHRVTMTAALNCSEGAGALQERVSEVHL